MLVKIKEYRGEEISYEKLMEIFQGWNAYAKWANSYKIRKETQKKIEDIAVKGQH